MENPDEKETPQTEEVTQPEVKRFTDADALIREINGEPDPELHAVQTCKGEFLVRELGLADSTTVTVGKWRDVPADDEEKQARREFDMLATVDQLIVQSIVMCVVKEDGTPFFKLANVNFMYSGPKQAKFKQFIKELYAGCLLWNPDIDPKNPDALQRIFGLR